MSTDVYFDLLESPDVDGPRRAVVKVADLSTWGEAAIDATHAEWCALVARFSGEHGNDSRGLLIDAELIAEVCAAWGVFYAAAESIYGMRSPLALRVLLTQHRGAFLYLRVD